MKGLKRYICGSASRKGGAESAHWLVGILLVVAVGGIILAVVVPFIYTAEGLTDISSSPLIGHLTDAFPAFDEAID